MEIGIIHLLFTLRFLKTNISNYLIRTRGISAANATKSFKQLNIIKDTWHCVKSAKIWNFPGPHFPVFSANTRKYGPEKTPYLATFHTVWITCMKYGNFYETHINMKRHFILRFFKIFGPYKHVFTWCIIRKTEKRIFFVRNHGSCFCSEYGILKNSGLLTNCKCFLYRVR